VRRRTRDQRATNRFFAEVKIMKAARIHSYEHQGWHPKSGDQPLKVENVPEPRLSGHHDVIVKIAGAGLCRTDLHIIEGIWKDVTQPTLPYILGHENAGFVEEIGDAVTNVKRGDPVICHPLASCGYCKACRMGEDMYCENGVFPGLAVDGGFAEYLKTSDRAMVKLAEGIDPIDLAPYADAGITAYRAAKKAARVLRPGDWAAVIGVGGLGHIAVQCLHELCAANVLAIDASPVARELAKELGAEAIVDGSDKVDEVKEISKGGCQVVIDFVAELGAEAHSVKMLRQGGSHIVVGYGGVTQVPTIDIIFSEISIVGSLVGNYTELSELMTLNEEGKVKLHAQRYKLDDVNKAIEDLDLRKIKGRGVLLPA
jgi:NAD+-dependent secondary alcohol dehydrogenase Adh1